MSTLLEELEQAAKRAGERCFERHGAQRMCINSQFDGCEHTKEERVLRERAERARLAPKLLSGEVQIPGVVTPQEFLAWITGPLDTSPETPPKPLTIGETERLLGAEKSVPVSPVGLDPISLAAARPPAVLCRGCGKPLEQKNYRIADGCPCNARAQTGSTRYPANAGEAAVKPAPCCYAQDRSLPFHSPDCGGETPGKKETSE